MSCARALLILFEMISWVENCRSLYSDIQYLFNIAYASRIMIHAGWVSKVTRQFHNRMFSYRYLDLFRACSFHRFHHQLSLPLLLVLPVLDSIAYGTSNTTTGISIKALNRSSIYMADTHVFVPCDRLCPFQTLPPVNFDKNRLYVYTYIK